MRQVRSERVCVIGAGPSGITAAKNLLDAGFENLVVYDRGTEVGGNWVFDAASGHSSVFETTHIISSKRFSQYADFPMPAHYPDYPSHRQLADYFRDYARHFGLYPFIQFETLVERCEPTEDGRWRVTTRRRGEASAQVFDQLVVANGHHWEPRWPGYPGELSCEYLHSHDFKRAEPFRGKRVLIIGGGNSACDAAVETSRVSAQTDISWRRGYWVIPKFLFGKPVDEVHNAVFEKLPFIPARMRMRTMEKLLQLIQGKNADYGLPEPDHRLGETHPLANSELLYFIRHGEIHPRPDVARFDGRRVHFTDGSSETYDTVIACTGFIISHPFFDPGLIDFSEGVPPLYLKMIHPERPNLHFIGLFQPFGCIWPGAELQSKIVARRLAGEWMPPSNLKRAVEEEVANPDIPQLGTPRHTITVDAPAFERRLREQLPDDYVSPDPVVRGSRDQAAE